jgi:hypothetical protein
VTVGADALETMNEPPASFTGQTLETPRSSLQLAYSS